MTCLDTHGKFCVTVNAYQINQNIDDAASFRSKIESLISNDAFKTEHY